MWRLFDGCCWRILVGHSLDQLGEAKVQHFDDSVLGDDEVGRLQIAMNNAGGVRRGKRIGNLKRVLQCVSKG
jgi:hypothetical protein